MAATVNWFEVAGDDVEGLVAFYSDLFGLEPKDNSGSGYREIKAEDGGIGGGIWNGAPAGQPFSIFYVLVDDVDKRVQQAEELGGKVLVPAQQNGPVRFAHVEDPAGNRVGIYQPAE